VLRRVGHLAVAQACATQATRKPGCTRIDSGGTPTRSEPTSHTPNATGPSPPLPLPHSRVPLGGGAIRIWLPSISHSPVPRRSGARRLARLDDAALPPLRLLRLIKIQHQHRPSPLDPTPSCDFNRAGCPRLRPPGGS
jgi:hypothetical protein